MVSVIVPVFNAEKTIGRCLDSLVSQCGIMPFEVIAIDDGSTDRTPEILDRYARSYPCLRTIRIPNGGPSRARNMGLDKAVGDYVTFCDADDWVDQGCYEEAVAMAEKESADIVVFGYKNVREGSTRTHAWWTCRRMGAREFAERCLLDPCTQGFAWNKLYSRELVANARFPEGIRVCEDLLFNIGIARDSDGLIACSLPGSPYNYDLSGESLTRNESASAAVHDVLVSLSDSPLLASAARGALYATAVKGSFGTSSTTASSSVDFGCGRDFYTSRSCPPSEKLKVATRRLVEIVSGLRHPLEGSSDERSRVNAKGISARKELSVEIAAGTEDVNIRREAVDALHVKVAATPARSDEDK